MSRRGEYGRRQREALRTLFGVIHWRAELGPRAFRRQLEAARDEVWSRATTNVHGGDGGVQT